MFIPYGKEEIQNGEYQRQNDIRIFVFPNTIKKICDAYDNNGNCIESNKYGAFYECTNLDRVILSNNLQVIGSGAFNHCSKLTTINIPSSVTQIGKSAFNDCSSLTTIDIPSSVTHIGDYAFYDCSSLKNLRVPKNCDCGNYCFPSGCNVQRY